MPYPAQGLYPSSLLYPLEAGVEFTNFTKDFKRLVTRYGRTLKNHRTNSSFNAILNILSGTKCLGDGRTMGCGDAIAYVLPSLSYEIGDHVTPVSGRGEWIIVTEKYASRIGDLRVFRTLALERYTPNATLEGLYTVVEPIAAEIAGLYDITKKLAQIIGLRAEPDRSDNIATYWNAEEDNDLDYYKVHRSLASGFAPSDVNLVGLAQSNFFGNGDLEHSKTYYFKVCAVTKLGVEGDYSVEVSAIVSTSGVPTELRSIYNITAGAEMNIVFTGVYDLIEKLVALELLGRYDVNALDVPGIELIGRYDLSEELISLEILSRYDVNALDVPGIMLGGRYDLRKELI
ncbi:hypothetical protein KA005_35880, partial [bacterium]|nr:hypothetical protein [bacterium]